MKSRQPVGIAGYGAYVPRYRASTASISATWRPRGAAAAAVEEKSVAGPDEDVVTMAIEAGRTAVERSTIDPTTIGAVWVGTESKPYAVKPSATVVAEAVAFGAEVVDVAGIGRFVVTRYFDGAGETQAAVGRRRVKAGVMPADGP